MCEYIYIYIYTHTQLFAIFIITLQIVLYYLVKHYLEKLNPIMEEAIDIIPTLPQQHQAHFYDFIYNVELFKK